MKLTDTKKSCRVWHINISRLEARVWLYRMGKFDHTAISDTIFSHIYTVVWSDYRFYRQMLCFFFHTHLRIKSKASAYMSRHLHIKSKTSAYSIGTCFRFYMWMPCFRFYTQMRVEINNKAFAYKIYSHFTQQCNFQ